MRETVFGDWATLRGVAAGMSHNDMHHGTVIFPEPRKLLPEQWLINPMERMEGMERNLVSFSRGRRSFLGVGPVSGSLIASLRACWLVDGYGYESW